MIPTGHRGWRNVAERSCYFKSDWEFRYANHLQFQKDHKLIIEWYYEPQTFWFENIKRGTRSYLPDFKVMRPDGSHYWIEVKGYMDSKSLTKIKRFKKYYPKEELQVVDRSWFLQNRGKLCGLTSKVCSSKSNELQP